MKKSHLFVDLMTTTYPACYKITSRMFTRHYDINDVSKRAKLTL